MKSKLKYLITVMVIALALPLGLASTVNKNVDNLTTNSVQLGTGYNENINAEYDENILTKIDLSSVGEGGSIPESYNLTVGTESTENEDNGIYIQVENQKQYNICWSFATLTMLETYLAKRYNEYYQFSAIHQATSKYVENGIIIENSPADNNVDFNHANGGGNVDYFLSYITRGAGPVLEQEMPFDQFFGEDVSSLEDKAEKYYKDYKSQFSKLVTVNEVVAFADATYLTGEDKINNRNAIKSHIMQYSACVANIHMPTSALDKSTNNEHYYLSSDYGTQAPNHMITIIGWDDNFKVDGYNSAGAWLCQNSWGNSYTYFYVFYDDQNIEDCVYGVKNAELTTPLQNTISNTTDLSGYEYSMWSNEKTEYYFATVTDVSSELNNYIYKISTPVLSNSNDTDAYTFYLDFTNDPASYNLADLIDPNTGVNVASNVDSYSKNDTLSPIGEVETIATLPYAHQIDAKYAVLVIKIKDLIVFNAYYDESEPNDLTKHLRVSDYGTTFFRLAFAPYYSFVLPTTYSITNSNSVATNAIGNFTSSIPYAIEDKYTQNNAVTIGYDLSFTITNPSVDITTDNIKIYTTKYNSGALSRVDYTDEFNISLDSYKVSICPKNSATSQLYIAEITLGKKIYRKAFEITNTPSYPINYYLNDGINSSYNSLNFAQTSNEIKLYYPTKTGYDFIGWFTDQDLTIKVTGETGNNNNGSFITYAIPTNSTSLIFYAGWKLSSPTITSEPTNITSSYNNQEKTSKVVASHAVASLSYQWLFSSDNTIFEAIDNTTDTLSVKDVADSGYYKCEITATHNGQTANISSTVVAVSIAKANYNLTWNYDETKPFIYDNTEKKVELLNVPAEGLVVTYSNNTKTEAGSYWAVPTIHNNNHNYNDPNVEMLRWEIKPSNIVIKIHNINLYTQEEFDNFSNFKYTIQGTLYNGYDLNVVCYKTDTSNDNLKLISASYNSSNNYNISLQEGYLKLVRTVLTSNCNEQTFEVKNSSGYLVDAELKVNVVDARDLDANDQKFLEGNNLTVYNVYSIEITDNTLNSKNNISISLHEEWKDKDIEVYLSTEDGLKLIESKIENNCLSFSTTELGNFIIVEAPKEVQKKNILIGVGIILGLTLFCCIFISLVSKHRKKKYVTGLTGNTPH